MKEHIVIQEAFNSLETKTNKFDILLVTVKTEGLKEKEKEWMDGYLGSLWCFVVGTSGRTWIVFLLFIILSLIGSKR